ncbi:response regulator [Cryomorpha ignava]|uniref:Response regulator n=1 Tax=Cryomorpha ignava TaxID=101383 RepID=A0A7K3WNY3_9FLAO|nr:response regulator [Cryomorpha ignava]NEN23373.1 response regulator [Cryomorpha ignava]
MNKLKIAVIDDISDVLELVEYNLRKEGMEVVTYESSITALDEIAKNIPDLVISDWMMPEPDGLELCRLLKNDERTKNIPLMMLTCKGGIHDYREAIRAGAQDYVVKPVRMEELIRRIKLLVPIDRVKYKFA